MGRHIKDPDGVRVRKQRRTPHRQLDLTIPKHWKGKNFSFLFKEKRQCYC